MTSKGPSFGTGGFKVKEDKQSNTDFDALMQSILGEEAEKEQPKFQEPPKKKELTEEQKEELKKKDEETVNLLNQLTHNTQGPEFVQVTPPVVERPLPPVGKDTHIDVVKYNIDITKPFNHQQPKKSVVQIKASENEELNKQEQSLSLEKQEEPEQVVEDLVEKTESKIEPTIQEPQEKIHKRQEYLEKQRKEMEMAEEQEDVQEESSGRKKKNKKQKTKTKNKTVHNKSKSKKEKKSKVSDEEMLAKKHFPKTYYDPTDAEIDPETGETDYFFNIEKTLRNSNMLWITKIIPLNTLDRLTYDKKIFDDYARRQHKKAEKLNASTAHEQYQYETRNKIFKALIGAGFAFICVLYVIFGIIPKNNYNNAIEFYNQEDWENAYTAFTELGNYKSSKFYSKYSEAMTKLLNKDYDGAKADFELLLDYQEYFTVSIQDAVYNCDYQKAINEYTNRNYEEAMKIFATISDYDDATTYYYKCGYEIADTYYENGEYDKALDAFFKVKAYEDSNERLSELADTIYSEAMNNYESGKYTEASEGFKFLSKYNYKESNSMISQCNYREGLNKYNDGNYEEARNLFSQVLTYKDSNAMYKECTYRIAKLKYSESIEDSLKEYSIIKEYRDVPTILKEGVFVIYGEWQITETNGTKSNPVDFKFNEGGLFQTTKNVPYVAISTEATPIQYKWDGSKYVTADGNYSITARAIDANTMVITCTEPSKSAEYTCVRKADYLTMLDNNNQNGDQPTQNPDNNDPSTNEQITQILQDYINKKTDGTVIVNEKEFNALLIIQQINDNLGQSK